MGNPNTEPDPEWKKGSAELLVLSLLEAQPRHGYAISKLIEVRSGGALTFHVTSLYPLLHRLGSEGWIEGKWVEKAGSRDRETIPSAPLSTPWIPPTSRPQASPFAPAGTLPTSIATHQCPWQS